MANTLKTPKVMPSEFCADGDKNTILTSPSTSNPQLANFSTGFPAITQTPIPNGGIPPERADFNGMFNLLSSALVYIQNGGQWTFVPEVSNAIGGYPAGAILNYYDATNKVNKRVISNINNNVNNFLLDPSQIGDSSKPWSYTENTPIVQDLTKPSADTVPSTKAVADESSRIVSIMNNYVDKTSKQNISGVKTITGDGWSLHMQSNSISYNTASSSFLNKTIAFVDKNGGNFGVVEVAKDTDNINNIFLNIFSPKGSWCPIPLGLRADGSGNFGSTAPRCNWNDSIVTTVSKDNRYVRFGNGLQICWGAGTGVQKFQQPFRDTDYMIADSDLTYHKYEGMWTTNKTTTQFEVRNSGNAQWIAIGYWY